jgi:hypothetical protein
VPPTASRSGRTSPRPPEGFRWGPGHVHTDFGDQLLRGDLADARDADQLGDTGRILLRPSGTEPLVRVMVEAATPRQASEVAERLADVVRRSLTL